MTKINNYVDKNIIRIISFFLILNPLIDVATSLQLHFTNLSFSVGMLFKVLFLITLVYYHVFIKNFSNKRIITYLFLVLIYLSISLLMANGLTLSNVAGLFRIMFFPLSLIMSYYVFKDKKTVIKDKTLRLVLFTYALLIIIPVLTNTAFDSYAVAKKGSVGWFNSANEIGAILAILLPLLFYNLLNKFKLYKLVPLLIVVVAIFIVGTKTPLVSLLLCIIMVIIKMFITLFKHNKKVAYVTVIVTFLMGVLMTILIIPRTNIYKNTVIHLNYLKIEKVSDLFDYKTMDHFVFGRRLSFLKDNNNQYASSSISKKLVGVGFNETDKLVEMDFFDVFYRTGILGFVLFLLPLALILRDFKQFDKRYALSVLMILFSSILAGHVLTSPSVSIIVSVVLTNFSLKKSSKRSLIIGSYDLGYGGIEKSLITLLKNLDYDDYLVTLVLEKKRGVFMDAVPEEVMVLEHKVSDNKNVLLRKLVNFIRQVYWIITRGDAYEVGITYATYSLPCDFVTKACATKTILYVHSNYYEAYEKDDAKTRDFFDKLGVASYDHVVFVSNESKADLCRLYPSIEGKAVTINNLVDYDYINKSASEPMTIKKGHDKVFLFVGRLDEESKRLSTLLEVAKKCKENKVKASFWIVGDGPDEVRYKKIVRQEKLDNVIFFGAQKNPYPYIKACDYLILTSKYEGFPVVYNEAIVLNKPIITTVNVSDDYVSIPNRFGFVVKKDAGSVYEQVRILVDENWAIKEKVNFETINKNRIKALEKLMEDKDG